MKKNRILLLVACLMHMASMDASWFESVSSFLPTFSTKILGHKTEIAGNKVPTAAIAAAAGVAILGVSWKAWNWYQNQPKSYADFTFIQGSNFRFVPEGFSEHVATISPSRTMVFKNGLIVLPSLQQVYDVDNASWKEYAQTNGIPHIVDEDRALIADWQTCQDAGESTFCGYHALSYAKRMVQVYDAAVAKNAARVESSLVEATTLRYYLEDLCLWVPIVKTKRDNFGQEFDNGSWLTSDEMTGNSSAGVVGILNQIKDDRIIVLDSFNVLFHASGADAIHCMPMLQECARSANFVRSFVVPGTALNQGLDAGQRTHWVMFTVMKLDGQLQIFFADSLYGHGHVPEVTRNAMYDKLYEMFSMNTDQVNQFEKDIYTAAVDNEAVRIQSDVNKIFPNKAVQYEFAGFVRTEPMELYEFDKIDRFETYHHLDSSVDEVKSDEHYYVDFPFTDGMKRQLKDVLLSRFAPVKAMQNSMAVCGASVGYNYAMLTDIAGLSPYNPRPRLITVWKNRLDEDKYFFVVPGNSTDLNDFSFCLKYQNFQYVLNGVDREIPKKALNSLKDLYDKFMTGGVAVGDTVTYFVNESLNWTPGLINASIHLLLQSVIALSDSYADSAELLDRMLELLRLTKSKVNDGNSKLVQHNAELLFDAASYLKQAHDADPKLHEFCSSVQGLLDQEMKK